MAERKLFHDSVVPLLAQFGLAQGLIHQDEKPHDPSARLRLLFSLTG